MVRGCRPLASTTAELWPGGSATGDRGRAEAADLRCIFYRENTASRAELSGGGAMKASPGGCYGSTALAIVAPRASWGKVFVEKGRAQPEPPTATPARGRM